MAEEQILQRLEVVCRNVFGRDDVTIERSTTANDIEEWDSLSHIRLIASLEKEFGMRFSLSEIAGLAEVGDLVDVLLSKATK